MSLQTERRAVMVQKTRLLQKCVITARLFWRFRLAAARTSQWLLLRLGFGGGVCIEIISEIK
jgi:hypothetical protein